MIRISNTINNFFLRFPQKKEFLFLDVFRILSCVSILLYHYTYKLFEAFELKVSWPFMLSNGAAAVDVFFFLSGFLAVFHMSHRKLFVSIKKKIFRLYPVYWVCMIITTVFVIYLLPDKKLDIFSWIINLTMLQSFLGIKSVDGAYWTLGYELVFYSIIALIQTRKNERKCFSKIAFVWILLSFVSIIIPHISNSRSLFLINKIMIKLFILDKAYAFLIGGMLVYFVRSETDFYSIATFVFSFCYVVLNNQNTLLMICITIITVILFLIESKISINGILKKMIRYSSRLTYPFYLLHQVIGYSIILLCLRSGYNDEFIIIIPIVIILIISIVLHEVVEKRLIRFIVSN